MNCLARFVCAWPAAWSLPLSSLIYLVLVWVARPEDPNTAIVEALVLAAMLLAFGDLAVRTFIFVFYRRPPQRHG